MIYNDVHIFSKNVFQGYHKYKDNWPEGSSFASTSHRIYIFTPEFTPQVSTHACTNFLSESREFYKKWR